MRETETRLRCDGCAEASDWFDMALQPLGDILAELRDAGWLRRKGGRLFQQGDYCPRCSGKKPNTKTPEITR